MTCDKKIMDLLSDGKHRNIKEIAEKLNMSYNYVRSTLVDMWWENKIDRTHAKDGSRIYFLWKLKGGGEKG